VKLLFCRACEDVFKLRVGETRRCQCGNTSGKYTDNLQATYSGKYAVPLGFANHSLGRAVKMQPATGWGERFEAFVIEKDCPTFQKTDAPQ
jgi:hypothetical protein